MADWNKRSQPHSKLRQRDRSRRSDELHVRVIAREPFRKNRIDKSAEGQLRSEGGPVEVSEYFCDPPSNRHRERTSRKRHCGRRDYLAANQRGSSINRRIARK